MKRWLNSNVAVLVWRLAVVYVVLALCRVAFWVYNADLMGGLEAAEVWNLVRGALRFDSATVVYTNALFVVMSLLPGAWRARRWWQRAMMTVYVAFNSVSVAVNMSDAVYFHYTAKRFTAEEIFFADNSNSVQLVFKFLGENLGMVAAGFALIALLVVAYRPKWVPSSPIKNLWARGAAEVTVLVAAGVMCMAGARGGLSRAVRPITLSNATAYTHDVGKANLILSNPFCIVRTMGRKTVSYKEFYPLDTLRTIYTPYHYPTPVADTLPDLSGRNVMVFVLESFSAEHSAYLSPHLYPDGRGYTPFLDSLMRTGYTFRHAYANGHKSIEALPSVMGSIPSFQTPFVLIPQSLGESHQMPRILADKGYSTLFVCGSERGSMGFDAYMSSAGVERQLWREDFERERGMRHFDGFWGVWDEHMIDFAGETLGTMPEPFFAAQFTLTSHHPFVVPDEWRDRLPEGRTKVHPGVAYVDASLRQFFERYGAEEWFRRTVFVFVADHVSSETFDAETRTALGGSRIIQFFYTPDGALQGECVDVAQQVDIMPSLLYLLGVREPYFAYGRNVFAEADPMTFYWSTSAMRYVSTDGEWTVFFDGERITDLYRWDDRLMTSPLALNDHPEVVERFERRLRAVVQQYFLHIRNMNYTVPVE
ncbi:MAG: sulfatase-like hydrolase/transferase [Rikenellaceae bacterium]|nr:sulfatase-like hydrolase/transferase [Rikenellaceae bacterium]